MINKMNYFFAFFNEFNPFFTATDSWYAYIFKIITEFFLCHPKMTMLKIFNKKYQKHTK
jgi:hypothetical protein